MVKRLALLLLASCGAPQPIDRVDPMAELESALFEQRVERRVHIESEGMIASSFDGEIVLDRPNVSMRFTGTFAGEPRAPWLEIGDRMRGGPRAGETAFDVEAPSEAFDAVAIGFARMGLLHNLARLCSGEPPDHADGGVRTWLTAQGAHEERGAIAFTLLVGGEPSGEARLVIADRLPSTRTLVVHFPEGDMRVNERYDL
jgi:hypothetical protein